MMAASLVVTSVASNPLCLQRGACVMRLLAKCLPENTQPICGIMRRTDLSTAIHRLLRKVPSKEKVMESSSIQK